MLILKILLYYFLYFLLLCPCSISVTGIFSFGICISVPEASRTASSSSFQAPLPVCAAGWPHFLYGQGRSSFSLSASVFFPPLTRRVIFGMQKAAGNCLRLFLEVPTRFELVHRGFADLCLTTWLRHHMQIPPP